jgi:predicted CXXCH cytochrome family protein
LRRRRTRQVEPPGYARWLKFAAPVAAVIALFAVSGVLYAAHKENNDAFCASCHTQPESQYYDRSLTQPVDLASIHATKDVSCIQCHSGPGATGRLTAMAGVAMPDLLAYESGHYRAPAVVTKPISDGNCLKCHAQVLSNRSFNNHFHYFLPRWQALDAKNAATCVECHKSHVTGGMQNASFLLDGPTQQICQRCHNTVGRG